MRSFFAKRAPRLETVGHICDSMRLGKLVARALLGRLADRDVTFLRLEVGEEVMRRAGLFTDVAAVQNGLTSTLRSDHAG